MRSSRVGLVLLLAWITGCGRLRFEDHAVFAEGGVDPDDGDAQVDDWDAATDGDGGPGLERDAGRSDAGASDGGKPPCPPGFAGTDCMSCVRFVDRDNTIDNPDGLSWQTAFPSITAGVAASLRAVQQGSPSTASCQVWARAGRYSIYAGSATDTLLLSPAVPLYGGFAGNERDPSERVVNTSATVLDGGEQQGNKHVYHVVSSITGGLIDGLTITGGHAAEMSGIHANGAGLLLRGGAMTVRNVLFSRNLANGSGAGISADGAILTIEGSRFLLNVAGGNGGAIESSTGTSSQSPTLTVRSSEAGGNVAGGNGGVLFATGDGNVVLENLVAARNGAGGKGGAIHANVERLRLLASTLYDNESNPGDATATLRCQRDCFVINTIIWNNGMQQPELENMGSGVTIRHSILRSDNLSGGGNSSDNPRFVSPPEDLHLTGSSPAIDAADGCAGPERDHDGLPRRDTSGVANTGVAPVFADIGAFEYQADGTAYGPFDTLCR